MTPASVRGFHHPFIRLGSFSSTPHRRKHLYIRWKTAFHHPQHFSSSTVHLGQSVMEVNLDTYLASISNRIDALSQDVHTKIRLPNRKPMIRTLLGIEDGNAFDLLIRNVKKEEEYHRLSKFVTSHLLPWLEQNPDILDKLPNLPSLIEQALTQPPTKGNFVFQRLGAGPKYKGKAEDMIRDIAPNLITLYEQASHPLSEEEVLSCLIQERISNAYSSENEVPMEQLLAAMKCLEYFQGISNDDRDTTNTVPEDYMNDETIPDFGNDEDKNISLNHRNSKQSGLHCERSLMNFLECRLRSDEFGPPDNVLLLQNVFINFKATSTRRKYMETAHLWSNVISDDNTGIIWSSNGRDGMCSEFDAVVMQKMDTSHEAVSIHSEDGPVQRATMGEVSLHEIWEAKHTISPSTLFDAIAKKGKAIWSLCSDPDAVLWRDIRKSSKRYAIKKRKGDENEDFLLFGIYGKEMLGPSSALDLLRVMAVSKVLSSDVNVIMKALDTGYVSLSPMDLKYGLNKLSEVLGNLREQQIQIRIVVESDLDRRSSSNLA